MGDRSGPGGSGARIDGLSLRRELLLGVLGVLELLRVLRVLVLLRGIWAGRLGAPWAGGWAPCGNPYPPCCCG